MKKVTKERAASPVASVASEASSWSAVPIPPASVHRASLVSISSAIAAGGMYVYNLEEAGSLSPIKRKRNQQQDHHDDEGNHCPTTTTPKPENTPEKISLEVRGDNNLSINSSEELSSSSVGKAEKAH